MWNHHRTTRTHSSSILIMTSLTSHSTKILAHSTSPWSIGFLESLPDSCATRISKKTKYSTIALQMIQETNLWMVPSLWEHSWSSFLKWKQRMHTQSLRLTTQFSDTIVMLPRVSASTTAPCSTVYRVLSMQSDSDGMILELSMSKNTNTMNVLKTETWIGSFLVSLWLLWVQLRIEMPSIGMVSIQENILIYSTILG